MWLRNAVREGDHLGAYGQMNSSCSLAECIRKCAEDFNWKEKRAVKVTADGKLHGVGVGMTMQDSGIAGIDTASASVRLIEDGSYILRIGATDMGTGCDTILAQIAAECLGCSVDNVRTLGVDTDNSPYDTGTLAKLSGRSLDEVPKTGMPEDFVILMAVSVVALILLTVVLVTEKKKERQNNRLNR